MTRLSSYRHGAPTECLHLGGDRIFFSDDTEHCLSCGAVVHDRFTAHASGWIRSWAWHIVQVAVAILALVAGGLAIYYLLVETWVNALRHWPSAF